MKVRAYSYETLDQSDVVSEIDYVKYMELLKKL